MSLEISEVDPLQCEGYDSHSTMIEERIVFIRARSFDEALKKGEKEARIYASNDVHKNPFGQQVRRRFLGDLDAFCLFDPPWSYVEVFSSMIILPNRLSDAKLARVHFGPIREHLGRRTKFLNAEFSAKNWWKEKNPECDLKEAATGLNDFCAKTLQKAKRVKIPKIVK